MLGWRPHTGQELLDLGKDLVLMRRPEEVITGRELDVTGAGDVRGHVASLRGLDVAVAYRLEDERRNPHTGQHITDVRVAVHP